MSEAVLHCGDALAVMAGLPDNSVDLIVTDPPYFRVKSLPWDRQWDTADGFIAWVGLLCEHWRRLLRPNGSLYCFASPKMAARVEVEIGRRFEVLNSIRWEKEAGWHQKAEKEALRSYLSPWEAVVFAEHFGADNMAKGEAGYAAKCDELRGFVFEPLRAYLDGEREAAGLTPDQVNALCGFREKGGMAGRHWFNASQFAMPTAKAYAAVAAATGRFARPHQELRAQYEQLRAQYEQLRAQYEQLRAQYEDLRRPFAVTAADPYTDVWDFPTVPARPGKHVCEKPPTMARHIVKTSTRPGAVVLDCFMGSGVFGEACMELGRNFVGIDADEVWVRRASSRIHAARDALPPLLTA